MPHAPQASQQHKTSVSELRSEHNYWDITEASSLYSLECRVLTFWPSILNFF